MPLYAIDDLVPSIDPLAFVHPEAVIIGNVTVGPHSSIWPCAVLRGDYGAIVVGEETSIQDGAVVHCTRDLPTLIGNRVVVGHQAHLEGCRVEDLCLIGVGSAILHEAVIGTGATVGAGAVVTNGLEVPPRALAVGVPAVIKPERSHPERIASSARGYVENAARFRKGLRRLDPAPARD